MALSCPNCGKTPNSDRLWLCNHCGEPFGDRPLALEGQRRSPPPGNWHRGWLSVGVGLVLVGAFAFALWAAIGASDARECGGPLPGLSLFVYGVAVFGLAFLLGICAVVAAVLRRSRSTWLGLAVGAAGLVIGWYSGLAVVGPDHPCRSSVTPASVLVEYASRPPG